MEKILKIFRVISSKDLHFPPQVYLSALKTVNQADSPSLLSTRLQNLMSLSRLKCFIQAQCQHYH